MRLAIASAFTLLLLSGFLFAIFASFLFLAGVIDAYFLFALVIAFNLIMWLIGPFISDLMYKYLYKLEWITIEEMRKKSPAAAAMIEQTCRKYGFKVPKLGIIPDKNPNAFTYGSGRWNSRLVITQGILEYLDEKERAAVVAHELGHVKNRDFIVMTIASTLLQLLYEAYVISRNLASGKDRERGVAPLWVVAIVAYVFYWIGQYAVLYLSRLREYLADEFSGHETEPNYLSSALIKISYGILANPDNPRLVQSTRFLGIANVKASKNIGLVYYNSKKLNTFEPLNRALLYDLKNPWAFVTELGSTHPLTGKRIRRLSGLAKKPLFDFGSIEKRYPVDEGRLRSNFLRDASVLALPVLLGFLFPILYILAGIAGFLPLSLNMLIGGWLVAVGIAMAAGTLYKYPDAEPEPATVLDLMSDVYASPVRGRMVTLKGTIVGKGVPGLIFSEDMLMQDKTGLMYLDYESWLPFFGNLLFGLGKVPQLIDKDAEVTGWFLRGAAPSVGLKRLAAGAENIKGFVKLGGLIGASLLVLLGVLAFVFL